MSTEQKDPIDVLREGEHSDETKMEARYGEGEKTNPMHNRALGLADVNGHKVRRAVTLGRDELLCLNDHDQLSLAEVEYIVVESAGDLHCSCGEHFDELEQARDHLLEAREDEDDA